MQQKKLGDQKLLKLYGLFSSLFLIFSFSALNADEYKSFANFKKVQTKSFETYKNKDDSSFYKYLKKEFGAYKVSISPPLYPESKPKRLNYSKSTHIKAVGPKISIDIGAKAKKLKDIKIIKKDILFDFYGTKVSFEMPDKIMDADYYPQNQKGISSFFNLATASDYEGLISDIKKTTKDLNLNDWALYLLVSKISQEIFMESDNAKLMTWFVFSKLGYAVKIGLSNKHIVLLFYSKKTIYKTPNYTIEDKKYYSLQNYSNGSIERLFTHLKNYPNAIKAFDLSMKILPKFTMAKKEKKLSFKQFGKNYNISYSYNQNMIDFMSTYPQANYEVFFNTPLDKETYISIASSLKKYLDGKKASEAMNFILSFIQKAFKYELDSQQFGREKIMFAEETLYYDKSDCEDRAILFANLIKELFHIPVIGVKYKDHMASAIYVPMKGDKISTKNRKFVIADPSYINANIGMSIPKYKHVKPQSYILIQKD